MKIFDISTDIAQARRYPGDPPVEIEQLTDCGIDELYCTSVVHLPVHLGTHIDFPRHVFENGNTLSDYSPSHFCGECRVVEMKNDIITGQDIESLYLRGNYKRLIIKGNGKAHLSKSAAFALIDEGIKLVGIDDITIGTEQDEYEVHKILLSADCLILEGLELSDVDPQNYELFALPIKLSDTDAVPCRAFLTYINF